MQDSTRNWLWWVVATVFISCFIIFALQRPAHAADLGSSCCEDLEERIAELEATTATKGNRKISLTITGDINKAILFGDDQIKGAQENSATPSVVDITGRAAITPDLYASYTLEIGVGGYDDKNLNTDTNGLYVRKSYWTLGSKTFGSLSVGELSSATENMFSNTNLANTSVAVRPLSLSPITGPSSSRASNPLDPFVGQIVNGVRYDSPVWQGFSASAAWSNDAHPYIDDDTTKEAWDVAIHYLGEPIKDFAVAASIGYSNVSISDNVLVAISIKNIPTGIFVTGDYGKVLNFDDGSAHDQSQEGWAIQAGIEAKLIPLGKTTVFGEYGNYSSEYDPIASNGFPGDSDYFGGGVVQSLDAAAMDVYVSVRQYSVKDDASSSDDFFGKDATVGVAGARIRF